MASKPARRCAKCKAIVRGRCEACDKESRQRFDQARNQSHQRKANKKIYDDTRWEPARTETFLKYEGRCTDCKKNVGLKPRDWECDHIIPLGIWRGDPFDVNNLAVRCQRCHGLKTRREEQAG